MTSVFAVALLASAVALPEPQTSGGMPLMQALKQRQSQREFRSDKLPAQVLSNLLWAAFGVNRAESGRRTAPSAMNHQEIDVYVATAEGVFVYDAKHHALEQVIAEDVRVAASSQEFARAAPVQLIFIADFARMADVRGDDKILYSAPIPGSSARMCISSARRRGWRQWCVHRWIARHWRGF